MIATSVQSPTRVDLAGGTLDLWPLYAFTGGAVTVNLAIDVSTFATIEDAEGVALESEDLGLARKYASLDEALKDPDPKLRFLRVAIADAGPKKGFRLKTKSESPIGGGLGGSSSLMISVLKAFRRWQGRPAEKTTDLVHRAHNLEARILNTPTGTQDYFPAASGGLNVITYSDEGVRHEVLPLKSTPIDERFLLVYTGRTHHSGLNNFEVMKGAVSKDATVMKALFDLKDVALATEDVCRRGRWGELTGLFRREYEARIRLAKAFTCPEIEQLEKIAIKAGAEAIKICGAGGGGCVMVWCPEKGRETIAEACRKAGFQVLNARPVPPLT